MMMTIHAMSLCQCVSKAKGGAHIITLSIGDNPSDSVAG